MKMILQIKLKLGMYFYFPRLRDLYPNIIHSKYNVKGDCFFKVKKMLLDLLALGLAVSEYAGMQKSLFTTILFWFNNNFSIILPIFLILIYPIVYKLIFKAVYLLVNHYFNKKWDFYSISSTGFYYFNYFFLSVSWVIGNYTSSCIAKVDLYLLFKVLAFILVLITLLIIRFSLGKKIKDKIVSLLFKYKKDKSTFISLIISRVLMVKYIIFVNLLIYFTVTGKCSYTLIGVLVSTVNILGETTMARVLKNSILWSGSRLNIRNPDDAFPVPDLEATQEHLRKKTRHNIFYTRNMMIPWTRAHAYFLNEFFGLNNYPDDKFALCIEGNQVLALLQKYVKHTAFSRTNMHQNFPVKNVDIFQLIGKDISYDLAQSLATLHEGSVLIYTPLHGKLFLLTKPRHIIMPQNDLIYVKLQEDGPYIPFNVFLRSHFTPVRFYIKDTYEQGRPPVYRQLYSFASLTGFNGGRNTERLGSTERLTIMKMERGVLIITKVDTTTGKRALARFHTVDRNGVNL